MKATYSRRAHRAVAASVSPLAFPSSAGLCRSMSQPVWIRTTAARRPRPASSLDARGERTSRPTQKTITATAPHSSGHAIIPPPRRMHTSATATTAALTSAVST